jgi:hypothetical protein
VTQPTAQKDQFEVNDPTALKEEFLNNLKILDPFLHMVSPTYMENQQKEKVLIFSLLPLMVTLFSFDM